MRREGEQQEGIAAKRLRHSLIRREIGITFDDERFRGSIEAESRGEKTTDHQQARHDEKQPLRVIEQAYVALFHPTQSIGIAHEA